MLNKKIIIVVLLLFLSHNILAIGSSSAKSLDASVDELFARSGIDCQLKKLANIVQTGFIQNVQEINSGDAIMLSSSSLSKANSIIQDSYSHEMLRKSMINEFKATFTLQDIEELMKWFDSPLGKKLVKAELDSLEPEFENQVDTFISSLPMNPPSPKRLALAQKLEKTLEFSENIAISRASIQLMFNSMITSVLLDASQKYSPKQIPVDIDNITRTMAEQMRPEMVARLLYGYRSLTDDELLALIKFCESLIGKKYYDTDCAGTIKALLEGEARFSHSIREFTVPSLNK